MFEGRFDQALTEHLGHVPLSRGGAWIEQLVVDVPPEWTASPDALPRDFLLAAVGAGAYLDLSCTTMFDLWSLDGLLPEIRGIRFDWENDSFTGFSALAAMDRLEYLWSCEVSEPVDLSHLQHLREAIIGGPGLLSVLRAPNLATLSLDVATLDPDFRIPRTLREFSFSNGTIEAAHLSEAVALERIMLSEIDGVDFGGLPTSHILQRAWVTAAKYVKGLEAIAAAPSMREIRLIRVSSIDSVDSLVDSPVEHAEITGCPDVDEGISRRLEPLGWHVQPFRRRRSANVLTVESGGDGKFEVVFADWAVLPDRLGLDFDDTLPDSDVLEATFLSRLEAMSPDLARAATADSEGDAVRLIFGSRKRALEARKIIEPLFRNSELLRDMLGLTPD